MESINAHKGYGKLGQVEDQPIHKKTPFPNRNRRFIVVLIPTVILAAIVLCVAATALIHTTTVKSNLIQKSNSIKAVCGLTNYPEACISSLQNATTGDPEDLLKLSLRVSLHQLTNLSSLPQRLINKVNDPRVKTALLDCQNLFADAADSLKSSVSLMKEGPGEKMLSVPKINDIKTWVSGAMTNLETCLDGLDEMDSSLHKEMEIGMRESKEYTSNSLAIVAEIATVLSDLHISMH